MEGGNKLILFISLFDFPTPIHYEASICGSKFFLFFFFCFRYFYERNILFLFIFFYFCL